MASVAEHVAEWESIVATEREEWREISKDPFLIFSDRAQWPQSITAVYAADSVFNWASSHHTLGICKPDMGAGWNVEWPLPVGEAAILHESHKYPYPGVVDAMPFKGEEFAAWIFVTDLAGYRIECFGTAKPMTNLGEPDLYFTVGNVKFRVTGGGPFPEGIAGFCKNVDSWWQKVGGALLGRGKGPGITTYTYADYMAKVHAFLQSHDGPVTVEEFRKSTGITRRTYFRYKKIWALPDWPELIASIR